MKRNLLESKYGDRLANLRERKDPEGLEGIIRNYWKPCTDGLKKGTLDNLPVDNQQLNRLADIDKLHEDVVQFGDADWRFFKMETGMEFYDQNEMNKEGNYLIGIKPEDYVYLCHKGMKVDSDSIVAPRVSKSIDFKNKMLQGERFPIPLLDYTKGSFSQEGLHRVIGAGLAGCEYVPCLICLDKYSKFNY